MCCARDRTSSSATDIPGWLGIPWPPALCLSLANILLPQKMRKDGADRAHCAQAVETESTHRVLRFEQDTRSWEASSLIQRQKLLSIFRFPIRQPRVQRVFRQRSMLKSALWEHRHF